MEGLKSAALPGVLAYVGIRVVQMFAPTTWGSLGQLAGGIGGAILGVWAAKKF